MAGCLGEAARMASMTVLAMLSGARALRACSSVEISLPLCLTTVTSERVGAVERGFAWRGGVEVLI